MNLQIQQGKPISSYSNALMQLRERVLQTVCSLLNATELTIWEQVMCLIEETGGWVDCTTLTQRYQNAHGSSVNMNEVIETLVEKHLLKKGVTLPD